MAEATNRVRSCDPVGSQAHVPLEVEHGGVRIGTEDAVDPPGSASKAAEAKQRDGPFDTSEHVGVYVLVAVAEPEAGLHQGSMSPLVDQAVLVEAPLCSEGQQRPDGGGAEHSRCRLTRLDRVAGLVEAAMEVANRRSPVTGLGTVHS